MYNKHYLDDGEVIEKDEALIAGIKIAGMKIAKKDNSDFAKVMRLLQKSIKKSKEITNAAK